MKGIELAESFFDNHVKALLCDEFGEYKNRIAVGLVGHGSECFGFDDEVSKDHDHVAGVCLWLNKEDEQKIGFRLMRAYNELVKSVNGERADRVVENGFQGVFVTGDFYRRYTGCDGAPKTWQDWLYTNSAYFAEATNGKVFCDELGEFTKIRNEILHGMPEDVRAKKIGSCALKAAQSGQYNYARCLAHGEEGAAMLALCEFVTNAIELAFLLNRKHCPYYKWALRSMDGLDKFAELKQPLEYLLTADNDKAGQSVKKAIVEDISLALADEINAQFDLGVEGGFLEPFAYDIQKRIKNSDIRNLHIVL